MARASQLPSGAWRVRVTDPDTGKRISITAPTEREANYKALEFELGKDRKARIGKTVGEAIAAYIDLFDRALKAFFANLSDPQRAVVQVQRLYVDYLHGQRILI